MVWIQNYNPLSSLFFSVLFALLPLIALLYFLAIRHMKGLYACAISLGTAIALALFVWQMPAGLAFSAIFNGMLFGLFPIGWVILNAMWLYNMNVESGQFNQIRNFLSFLTPDRRLQAVLIAFVLGAFLEGTAGFGTPVAISAALLIGLGFPPLTAAAIALISNSAPVAFGGLGLPATVASQITGLDPFAVGKASGLAISLLCFLTPFVITTMLAGYRKMMEIFPILFGVGFFYAGLQYSIASFINPYLPMFLSSGITLILLATIFHYWQPKSIWRFPEDPPLVEQEKPDNKKLLQALLPFILLAIMVFLWSDLQYTGFKSWILALEKFFYNPVIHWPGLHEKIMRMPPAVGEPTPYGAIYFFNFISSTGTAIFLASLLSVAFMGKYSHKKAYYCFGRTLYQLRFALGTLPIVLALAYIMNYSGMSTTLGLAFNSLGAFFPFFAPLIGYIGVFLTGSEVSCNALFGLLQRTNAEALGFDPNAMIAANMTGGGSAKMITAQTISVATAATGQSGQEGKILERTWKVSLLYLGLSCLFSGGIAYWG